MARTVRMNTMEFVPRLRLRRGTSPLEKRAIDAHAKRLGLRVCRETRLVLDAGIARGGFSGLKASALAAGNARILGLEALSHVKEKQGLRAVRISLGFERPPHERAQERISESRASLYRATSGTRAICERFWVTGELDNAHLLAVLREMRSAYEAMDQVLSESALGYATPGDLRQLAKSFAAYINTYRHYEKTFLEIIDTRFKAPLSPLAWLGKPNAQPRDPLEGIAQKASDSVQAMFKLGPLFTHRQVSFAR